MGAEGFAAIPNWMIRDESISAYAIAVYGSLASHTGPGGVHPSQAVIAREARCSKRTVINALDELEALGVVERVRRRNAAGRAPNGYVLHPHGRLSDDDEVVPPVSAHDARTALVVSAPDDGGMCTTAQSTLSIEEQPMKKNPYGDSFEAFWAVYPRRSARKAALAAFTKACRATPSSTIVEGARRYAGDPNLPELRYVPLPATWLNQGRWEDEPLPARGGRPSAVEAGLDLVARADAADGVLEMHGMRQGIEARRA